MLDRQEALRLLKENTPAPHLVQHALASEAVMRGLARRLGKDEDLWGLAGLLHDLDYSSTKDAAARHGLDSADMLQGRLPDEALQAVRAHAWEMNGVEPREDFDFALRCGETVTGLVSAAALVRPEGMTGMQAGSLKKKMKDKAFARNVRREVIRECEKLGLELGEFLTIAIEAMQGLEK